LERQGLLSHGCDRELHECIHTYLVVSITYLLSPNFYYVQSKLSFFLQGIRGLFANFERFKIPLGYL
jgi:hypothetical protein